MTQASMTWALCRGIRDIFRIGTHIRTYLVSTLRVVLHREPAVLRRVQENVARLIRRM
jgi:hypothetical protein